MKLTVAILFSFLLYTNSYAQFSIDSSEFPLPTTKYPLNFLFTFTGSAGAPGPNQTYDFTNASIFGSDTLEYIPAGATPWAINHPGATVVAFEPVDSAFYYHTRDAGAFVRSGVTLIGDFGAGRDTISANYLPGNEDTIISNEYVYGNSGVHDSYIRFNVTAGSELSRRVTRTYDVDGWGTLTAGFNTWDTVLRVKLTIAQYDTLFFFSIPFFIVDSINTTFEFYAEGIKHPVVVADSFLFGIWVYQVLNFPFKVYGCTDTAAVNFNPIANEDDSSCIYCTPVSFTISSDTTICNGDSISLTVTGGISKSWSTGDTIGTIMVSPDTTTTFSVYLSDIPGCWTLGTVKVTVDNPVNASFWTDVLQYPMGDTVDFYNSSTKATNYNWDFGDATNSTSANPKHAFTSLGDKKVSLVASNSCYSDTFTRLLTITPPTSLDDLYLLEASFKIYPNPGDDHLFIEYNLSKASTIEISIIDIVGRRSVLFKDDNQVGAQRIEVNGPINKLASGIYTVEIRTNSDTIQKRWIK